MEQNSRRLTWAELFLWGIGHGLLARPLFGDGLVVEGRCQEGRMELYSADEYSLITVSGRPWPLLMRSSSCSMGSVPFTAFAPLLRNGGK